MVMIREGRGRGEGGSRECVRGGLMGVIENVLYVEKKSVKKVHMRGCISEGELSGAFLCCSSSHFCIIRHILSVLYIMGDNHLLSV